MADLPVFMVWSTQLGADRSHVPGAGALMSYPHVRHYWDPQDRVGATFLPVFPELSSPAWDIWMLFEPGVRWEDDGPPEPSWWEHQLGVLDGPYPDRRLDPDRFARNAARLIEANRDR